jgi:hypothetical protein
MSSHAGMLMMCWLRRVLFIETASTLDDFRILTGLCFAVAREQCGLHDIYLGNQHNDDDLFFLA